VGTCQRPPGEHLGRICASTAAVLRRSADCLVWTLTSGARCANFILQAGGRFIDAIDTGRAAYEWRLSVHPAADPGLRATSPKT